MRKLWRDHSLTILALLSGAAMIGWAWTLAPGQAFDTWLELGGGLMTVGLWYVGAWWFREKRRPED